MECNLNEKIFEWKKNINLKHIKESAQGDYSKSLVKLTKTKTANTIFLNNVESLNRFENEIDPIEYVRKILANLGNMNSEITQVAPSVSIITTQNTKHDLQYKHFLDKTNENHDTIHNLQKSIAIQTDLTMSNLDILLDQTAIEKLTNDEYNNLEEMFMTNFSRNSSIQIFFEIFFSFEINYIICIFQILQQKLHQIMT